MIRGVLLDSHVLLWFFEGSSNLTKEIRRAIDQADICYFSIASIWELAIKASVSNLKFDPDQFTQTAQQQGFVLQAIELAHIEEIKTLPFHHRDPFDRMLVAQAMAENLLLLTADQILGAYSPRHVKVFAA